MFYKKSLKYGSNFIFKPQITKIYTDDSAKNKLIEIIII